MTLRLPRVSFFIILTTFCYCCSADDSSSKKDISPALKDLAASETCPNVMCTKPPSDISCNKTEVTNPNILNKLGTLKGCCSAFRCSEKDGSVSTYFGITGEEISNDISNSSSSSTPQDKCSLIICPKPDEKDASCVVSNAPDVNDFKPKGDLQNCCPLYNCTVSADRNYHTRFVLSAGNVPKDASVATKEKGTPDANNKCPLIKCATKPVAYGCEATSQNFSSSLQALGSFQECCPLWKCCFDDGTHFTHFEITAMSFWMAETSYFSSKKNPTTLAESSAPEKAEDNPQSDSASPKGRSFDIQPAPGLPQTAVTALTTTKQVKEKTTAAPAKVDNAAEGTSQKQQQTISFAGGSSKSSKSVSNKNKDKVAKESEEEDGTEEQESEEGEEEEYSSKSVKKTVISQQQQNGKGQQQQQQMTVMQPVVINKIKERRQPPPPPPPQKGLLSLSIGDLKVAK